MSRTSSVDRSAPTRVRPHELELYRVEMPLTEPWRIAVSEVTMIETVMLRLCAEDHEAWAEVTPPALPHYCADWTAATFALLCQIAPYAFAVELNTPTELQDRLAAFRGNPFSKAALDTAWWMLEARRSGQALHAALGARRHFAEVGADYGVLDSHEELLERIQAAVEIGYRRVKLKVRPGWDIPMLEAVRAQFPDLALHVDCNGAYTLADLELMLALDRFELEMIEQPLAHDDLIEHARLQEQLQTPICLDESIVSPRHARHALELGSCQAINVKPGRVGGLTPSCEIIELCRAAGVRVWVGGMLEGGLGAATCLALACLDGCNYPSDVFPSDRFYARDLATPPLRFSTDPAHGRIAHTESVPGLQQVPDPEMLDANTLERRVVKLI